jgi:hypothetical protein
MVYFSDNTGKRFSGFDILFDRADNVFSFYKIKHCEGGCEITFSDMKSMILKSENYHIIHR